MVASILSRNAEINHAVRAGKERGIHIQLVVELLLVELHLGHLHHRVREAVVEEARLNLEQLLGLLREMFTHLRIDTRIAHHLGRGIANRPRNLRTDLHVELHALAQLLPHVLVILVLVPVRIPRRQRCDVVRAIHLLHQLRDVEVRWLNLLADVLTDEIILDLLVGLQVVVACPLAQRTLSETWTIIVLPPPVHPIPFELGHIIARRLGRLRAEVHPQLEVLLAGTNIVKTPAHANPLFVVLRTVYRQAVHDKPAEDLLFLVIEVLAIDGIQSINKSCTGIGIQLGWRSCLLLDDHRLTPVLHSLIVVALILLDNILVFQNVVTDTQQLNQLTRSVGRLLLFLPCVCGRQILEHVLQSVRRNIRLGLTVEDPTLLARHGLVIDLRSSVCIARLREAFCYGIL